MTEFEKYAAMAKAGTLPADFNKWDLSSKWSNETIAHVAASVGYKFPIDFPGWEWKTSWNWTVAHEAAFAGYQFPIDFSGWGWKNNNGCTVAHVAARMGYKFPIDFPGLDWIDDKGRTVRQVYEKYLACNAK